MFSTLTSSTTSPTCSHSSPSLPPRLSLQLSPVLPFKHETLVAAHPPQVAAKVRFLNPPELQQLQHVRLSARPITLASHSCSVWSIMSINACCTLLLLLQFPNNRAPILSSTTRHAPACRLLFLLRPTPPAKITSLRSETPVVQLQLEAVASHPFLSHLESPPHLPVKHNALPTVPASRSCSAW